MKQPAKQVPAKENDQQPVATAEDRAAAMAALKARQLQKRRAAQAAGSADEGATGPGTGGLARADAAAAATAGGDLQSQPDHAVASPVRCATANFIFMQTTYRTQCVL